MSNCQNSKTPTRGINKNGNPPPGTDGLFKLIKLVLYTGHVEGVKPVSLMIVANPESGKTYLLKHFSKNQGVKLLTDFTAYGLAQFFTEIKSGKIKHFLIPEMLTALSRVSKNKDKLIPMLNALTEDGIEGIATYAINFQSEDEKPINAGIIFCITTDAFQHQYKAWIKNGFASRALPAKFDYTEEDEEKVWDKLMKENETNSKILFDLKKSQKVMVHEKIASRIKILAKRLKVSTGGYKGWRLFKQLKALCMASAVAKKRKEVTEEDFNEVFSLIPFIHNPLLGDDCSHKILQLIPCTRDELLVKLQEYSERTIDRRIENLKQGKIIDMKEGKYQFNDQI